MADRKKRRPAVVVAITATIALLLDSQWNLLGKKEPAGYKRHTQRWPRLSDSRRWRPSVLDAGEYGGHLGPSREAFFSFVLGRLVQLARVAYCHEDVST